VLAFGVSVGGFGQFGTPSLTDGMIDPSSYSGFEYFSTLSTASTQYRIAWNDDNLFIAAQGNANFANDNLHIYIDLDNAVPVNSDAGLDYGQNFDNLVVKLPFNADYLGSFRNSYNVSKRPDSDNWPEVSNLGIVIESTASSWIEVAIPWDVITDGNGRPAFFNFLMFITYPGNKIRSIPYPNFNGASGTPDDYFYFHVPNTTNTVAESPFSKVCFTQHSGGFDYGYNTIDMVNDPALPNVLYNMTASQGSGEIGEAGLYMDDDLEIQHDLVIGEFGRLQPGGNQVHTITMTGTDPNFGSIYNDGNLETIPDLGNTTDEKLRFVFSGNTLLRSNGGLPASQTKFSDITINTGASLNADAAGLLDAELHFGTLVNNGTFDMGSGLTGFVNWTLRGVSNNVYGLNTSGNPTNFHRLIIGSNATLENSGTTPIEITLREDFEILGSFVHDNGTGGQIDLNFESVLGENQVIKTFDSNPANPIQFAGLKIASGSDVRFEHVGANPPVFEIYDTFTLTSGRLFTIDDSMDPVRRFELVLKEGASLNAFGATSGYTSPETRPCFVDGPLSIEILGDAIIEFPVGKMLDFRPIEVNINQDGPQSNTIVAEHFHESAAALPYLLPNSPEAVLNVSEIRYWSLEYLTPSTIDNVVISLKYGDNDDSDGVTVEGGLRILFADETETEIDWISISSSGGSGGSITSDQQFTMPYGSNNGHLLAIGNILNNQNPLPVTWLTFTGVAEERANTLMWSTASELNNDFFEVQRSRDGAPFEPIGQVQGQGTTNLQSDYAFSDDEAPSGTVYYRLQQFDFDGASDFSETVAINRKGNAGIYPNPFNETLNIAWEQNSEDAPAVFTLWDATGRKVAQYSVTPPLHSIPAANLPHGSYFGELRVKDAPPIVFKLIK
jgi:hypothetical protein